MRTVWLSLSLLVLASTQAAANAAPDPSHSSVTGDLNGAVLIAPGNLNGTVLHVVVRNHLNNPWPNALVVVVYAPAIHPCAGFPRDCMTNAQGACDLSLRGGGCVLDPDGYSCLVIANGIELRAFHNTRSPDNAGHTASAADGSVNTADLPYFADEFRGHAPAACHDYDNTGVCDTGDLPFFGDAFRGALHCTLERR